jgi:hypothetical protein
MARRKSDDGMVLLAQLDMVSLVLLDIDPAMPTLRLGWNSDTVAAATRVLLDGKENRASPGAVKALWWLMAIEVSLFTDVNALQGLTLDMVLLVSPGLLFPRLRQTLSLGNSTDVNTLCVSRV